MNEKSDVSTIPLPQTNPPSQAPIVAQPQPPDSHPRGFYYIFFGEFAERCSYYGMRAILPLYLTSILAFSDSHAAAIYSSFKAACYLLPLLGGFLADRYFGRYWTIVGFSVPYVLGHFVLGIQSQVALLFAMVLLAGGSGVIKPNISALMGMTYDQQRPGKEALRSSAFLWFYFSINVGATISLLCMPSIRDFVKARYDDLGLGYKVAFQFPAWLMVIALAIFAAGKRYYAIEPTGPPKKLTSLEKAQRRSVLGRLLGIFLIIVFFWVAYEQNDNLWTFFARDNVNLEFNTHLGFTWNLAPDQFQWINGLLVLTFAPSFGWFFRRFDPDAKLFKATTKILIGFVFTAGASVVMALAAQSASGGEKVSGWWMVLAFFVLTAGEVLVYGTGLELSFTAAPANMKSFITACFLVTNFAGNLINTQLSPLYNEKIAPAPFYFMTAGIVGAATVAFYFVGRRFNRGMPTLAADYAAPTSLPHPNEGITPDAPDGSDGNLDERIQ
jgi:POT family proton-dependent oligopeptide transporter